MSPYGELNLWVTMCEIEAGRKNYDTFHGMGTFKETFVPIGLYEGGELLKELDREDFIHRLDGALTHILERLGVDLSRLDEPEKETEG